MRIIGLSGYARSGKDTAGQALMETGYERRAFADEIRAHILRIDPYVCGRLSEPQRLSELVENYGWSHLKTTPYGPDVRRILANGGERVRDLDPTFWVRALWATMEPEGRYVITDVRRANEFAAVVGAGGAMLRIERPGVGPSRDLDGRIFESETDLDGLEFTARFSNSGTALQLQERIWSWEWARTFHRP